MKRSAEHQWDGLRAVPRADHDGAAESHAFERTIQCAGAAARLDGQVNFTDWLVRLQRGIGAEPQGELTSARDGVDNRELLHTGATQELRDQQPHDALAE